MYIENVKINHIFIKNELLFHYGMLRQRLRIHDSP